jgi:short subunit fatty acids transporter
MITRSGVTNCFPFILHETSQFIIFSPKGFTHPLFLGFFSRRVNQRADSGGGEWSNAPLLFSAISEGFPAILVF